MPPGRRGSSQKYVPFSATGAENTPMQFGPTSRMPPARAVSRSAACSRRPRSSTSPNPDVRMTAARTPRAASAVTAGRTAAGGTLTSARSTPRGRSATSARLGRPRMGSPDGLTTNTSPAKPPRSTLSSST